MRQGVLVLATFAVVYHLLQATAAEVLDTTTEKNVENSTELEGYALQQMHAVVDYILYTKKNFVVSVLSENANTIRSEYAWLKRYVEQLNQQLESRGDTDAYQLFVEKLNFLQNALTKQLEQHLPAANFHEYKRKQDELNIWLDKNVERMRIEFDRQTMEEPLRNQYFNAAFDDIPRVSRINDKLTILADVLRIIVNKVAIRFTDLYVQR